MTTVEHQSDETRRNGFDRRRFIVGAGSLGLSLPGVAGLLAAVPVRGLSARGAAVAQGEPRPGGSLTIAKEAEAVGFDPHLSIGFSAREIIEHLYNGLVRLDENSRVAPDLAESWNVSPDQLTYTFNLRRGVKFHNGRELTADDVVYSVDRIMAPENESTYSSRFAQVANYSAIDPYTVQFTLKEPYAPFLGFLAGGTGGPQPMVVAREAVEEHGDLTEHGGGTGPFMLSDFVRDNFTTLARWNEYFESPLPYLDEVTFQILPDETARLAAVSTGRAHLTILRLPQSWAAAEDDPNLAVIEQMSGNYYALGINTARPPFDKQEVREALSWAIDRQEIIDGAVGDNAVLLGPIPPAYSDWALPVGEYPSYKRDVARAKELLAMAGYPSGFETTIMASQQYPLQVSNAQIIQQQLADVGIRAEIALTEWAQYIQNWRAREFDLFSALDSLSPEPGELAHHYGSSGAANVYGLNSPEVDELLRQANAATDQTARQELFAQVQRALVEEAPKLWLYSAPVVEVASPNLLGYRPLALEWRLLLRQAWLSE